ncbi:enolase-phosphatase E1-like protein [Leptotrombidium deliense]|uniref:Enolase-phosphatase E1-like protein n=1 Tax=Leptotrombidium deliense TaxID=299467 RepID=A0A443SV54_9ACAR|nr:enolase-phosphatase E1-like protein [Leptotrombidium deliense]
MVQLNLTTPTAIIIGIHGCTSSMDYFNKEIYDFVQKYVEQYLTENEDNKKVNYVIERMKKQAKLDLESNMKETPQIIVDANGKYDVTSVIKNLKWNIKIKEQVHKYHAVFLLCDWIWSWGYQSGMLKSHVFPEVPKCLDHWRMHKFIKLFTISTAEISGQKQFLKSTIAGDLCVTFNNYVQFSLVNKRESSFYSILAKLLRETPSHLLFLTAFVDEAKAAKACGIRSILVVRPGNPTQDTRGFETIEKFTDIKFEDDPNNPTTCC